MKIHCTPLLCLIIIFLPIVDFRDELSRWKEYVAEHPKAPRDRRREINQYLDELLSSLRKCLSHSSFEPLQLPDYTNHLIAGTVVGNITLHNGLLFGVSTVDRYGNAIIMYKYPMIRAHIPLGFKRLLFNYEYYAELIGISGTSVLNGTVSKCHFLFDFLINVRSVSIFRNQFRISEIGQVTVSIGDKYSGIVVDVLVRVIKPILLPVIKDTIEQQVGYAVDSIIDILGMADEDPEHIFSDDNFTMGSKKSLLKIRDMIQCARKGTESEKQQNLNEYIDQTFVKLKIFMKQAGIDPLHINKPLSDPKINLTKGVITGISSIVRKAQASFYYKNSQIQISIPVGFNNLTFAFDYESYFSSGVIVGSLDDFWVQADVLIDLMYIRFVLENFEIKNMGRIDIWLHGSALGYTTSVIIKTFQPFWEPILYMALEDQIHKTVIQLVDDINNVTCRLLGNCEAEVEKYL